MPATSTIHAVLDRNGLVARLGRPRRRAQGTALSAGAQPNDLWCADFKGEFKLGNGRYCYPLTVTDHASRYLLLCEALDSVCEAPVIDAFVHLFRQRGLPRRDPNRQRRSLRQPECPVQPVQTLGLLAQARHRHRAHQAR